MATFERCFLSEKELQKEEKGAYYTLREEESVCDMLLDEFGVTGEHRHIVNGHVPVRSIKGENPIKANGKLLVIDGGFSKAYHSETGIAGYTLVYHSRGFQLVQHEPFQSTTKAIEEGLDIRSTTIVVELSAHRQMVKDTDKGAELKQQIHDLENLLYLADMIEPNRRSYDGLEELRRLCKTNLNCAMLFGVERSIDHIRHKRKKLHSQTLAAQQYFLTLCKEKVTV